MFSLMECYKMANPQLKTPVMRWAYACPFCKADNFIEDSDLAAGGIENHLGQTRVPKACDCPKCCKTVHGADIKVLVQKWGHD